LSAISRLERGKSAYWIEMLVYHRTYRASKIVRDGFRDDTWTAGSAACSSHATGLTSRRV
jgi:hypothetical protein